MLGAIGQNGPLSSTTGAPYLVVENDRVSDAEPMKSLRKKLAGTLRSNALEEFKIQSTHWVQCHELDNSDSYYLNRVTGEISYDPPPSIQQSRSMDMLNTMRDTSGSILDPSRSTVSFLAVNSGTKSLRRRKKKKKKKGEKLDGSGTLYGKENSEPDEIMIDDVHIVRLEVFSFEVTRLIRSFQR